jgi:hypothetical protein
MGNGNDSINTLTHSSPALVTARERLLNPSEIVSSKFLKNHRCEDAFLVVIAQLQQIVVNVILKDNI